MFKYLLHTKIEKMKSLYPFFLLLRTLNSVRFYKTKHVVDHTDFEKIGEICYHKKKDILSYNYLYAIIFLCKTVHGVGGENFTSKLPRCGEIGGTFYFFIFNLFLFRIILKCYKQLA